QGRPAHPAEELSVVPSPWRNCPDVVPHLQGHAAVGAGDEDRRGQPADAALVRRSGVRSFCQRQAPARRRRQPHRLLGGRRPLGSEWTKDAEPGVAYQAGDVEIGRQGEGTDLLGKFNPGLGAQDFSMFDSAKFVPKGSDIVFSMHYTAIGKETTDRSKLGLIFAKHPPKMRYYVSDGPTASNLAIPASDNNAEVVSEMTATADTQLVYMQPHMHLRGKDYEVRLISPSAKSETIFKAKWDFNWQLGFDLAAPIPIPRGTRIVGIAHYDNSANNKFNPDPTQLIVWGIQNWEEMQNCFMGFLVDPKMPDPKQLFVRSGPSLLPRGQSGPTTPAVRAPEP